MRKILLFSLMTLFTLGVCAQKRTDRAYVRVGNRMFRDSLFIKAEENYLKAVDMNPELLEGYFNLGNAYVGQQKPNEAIDAFRKASNMLEAEKKTLMNDSKADSDALARCKMNLAKTYHNTGVVYHVCQQFDKAIEAYKDALRNNPEDDQTRYNLILAQRQQKQQQQQQQQDQQQEQQQQDQQQDQQEQQQDQKQQQEQQEQQSQEDMSKENAEQILDAAMQDEKDIQERVQEQLMKAQPRRPLEKDW